MFKPIKTDVEDAIISSVDGVTCDVAAKIVQHFWPHQVMTIDTTDFPHDATAIWGVRPSWRLTLGANAEPIEVHLYLSKSIKGSGKRLSSFVPLPQPYRAIDGNELLREASFDLFNFTRVGDSYRVLNDVENNRTSLLGTANLCVPGWTIKIDVLPHDAGDADAIDRLRSTGGIAATHYGRIVHPDGLAFSVDCLMRLLVNLRAFLSFVRCAPVGIANVREIDHNTEKGLLRFGMEHTAPWTSDQSWFVVRHNRPYLDRLFRGFFSLMKSSRTRAPVRRAINWYVQSLEAVYDDAVVNAVTAIEAISGVQLSKTQNKKLSTEERLSKMLKAAYVADSVPSSFTVLTDFFKKYKPKITTGPGAVIQLRNWIVHSDPVIDNAFPKLFEEANKLIWWYVELLLLHMFDYQDDYRNRVSEALEPVPWR